MFSVLHNALGIKTRLHSVEEFEALLTFDDGPDPELTGKVLDILDKFSAKAVFFVIGSRIDRGEHLLREILDRGHIIGNHSFSHWPGKPPGARGYLADVEQCQARIFDACGYTPTLYRPPLGVVTPATIITARKLGLEIYKWSLDTNDWRLRDDESAKLRSREVADRLSHRDIILMHDDNPHTPVMLSNLLKGISQMDVDLSSFVDRYKNKESRRSGFSKLVPINRNAIR